MANVVLIRDRQGLLSRRKQAINRAYSMPRFVNVGEVRHFRVALRGGNCSTIQLRRTVMSIHLSWSSGWNICPSMRRVTRSDLKVETLARAFHVGDAPPKIYHFIRVN
jgi:hypothetical protein